MSDINTEKTRDRHAKCPLQFRGMTVIYPVNVGQNVRYFKKVLIYTDISIVDVQFLPSEWGVNRRSGDRQNRHRHLMVSP